jgi:predicted NodU family carbamoyl transferase
LDNRGKLPNKPMRHGYWGPSFEDEAIETALRTYKLRYVKLADPARAAAELLTQGKILGWFQGPPLYWRLIDEFEKRTGVNTSFNLRGEAIVHTPTDAIRTFFSSGMTLVIGSFLFEK